MHEYKYLVIGGGMTADAAVRGIRQVDADGSIGMIGNENYPPYNRPPLSKGLWKGKSEDKIWRGTERRLVDLHLDRTAVTLNLADKKVIDEQGEEYHFHLLLLATGGTPNKFPFGDNRILYYRTLNDYRLLREVASKKLHFAVIGGGFIGSEIAAALNMNGREVTMIIPEAAIGSLIFPENLANFVTQYYRDRGVEVMVNCQVDSIEPHGNLSTIVLDNGQHITVDQIVAGIGLAPNTELAEQAGLQIDNGIVVNEFLQTNNPSVYAAGDVASFYNFILNKRMRVEHEDNANTMGEIAGKNMAGERIPYTHIPYFYSDLFDLGYEAIGLLSSRMDMVEDWQDPFKKGVVYYLDSGKVRGVLLWNIWGKIDEARALIANPGPFNQGNLVGRIK